MLADKNDSQHRTLAPMFGSMPKNLETMFRKKKNPLNQCTVGLVDEELPEMGNWTGNRAHHPSLLLQLENRIWKLCQSTGSRIQGQVPHASY